MSVLVVEFHNPEADKDEGREWSKICDFPEGRQVTYEDFRKNDALMVAFSNNLNNLDAETPIEVRLRVVTDNEWDQADKLGRALA